MADASVAIGADLSQLRRELAKLPNLSADAAQKTLISVEKVVSRAEKAAKRTTRELRRMNKRSAREAERAREQVQRGLLELTDLAGGPADDIRKIQDGLAALSTPAGAAAVAVGGAAVAVGAFAAAGVQAVAVAADYADELNELDPDTGLRVAPATLANLRQANAALNSVQVVAKAMVVTLAAELAPAVNQGAVQLVKIGLVARDAFEEFTDGQDLLEEMAVFVVQRLVQAFAAPVDGLVTLVGLMGDVADAAGADGMAASLQAVEDRWDSFTEDVARTSVEFVFDGAADAVGRLDDATRDYDAEAQALVGSLQALGGAQAAAADEFDATDQSAKRWRETIRDAAEAANPLQRQARLVAEIDQLQADGALTAAEAMQARLVVIRETNEAIREGIEAEQAAADKAAAIVARVSEHRLTEAQRLDEEEQQALAALADTEVATEEQVAAVKAEFHQRRLEQIAEETEAARLSAEQQAGAFSTLFGGVADASRQAAELIGQNNERAARRAFAVYKATAISQALINGAVAFTRALAELGPIFGPIAAGGIAATTAGQVAVIAAQSPSFTDTPEAMFAGSRGLTARFAPGDHVIAAQSPREVQRQADDLTGGRSPELVVAPIATYRHYTRVTRDELRRPTPLARAVRSETSSGQTGW